MSVRDATGAKIEVPDAFTITIAANGAMTQSEITDTERKTALVDEFGLSEEIVDAIPPDVLGGVALF